MYTRMMAQLTLGLVLLSSVGRTARAETYEYLVTDLGTLGGPTSSATGLNESGQIVGLSTVADANYHAAFWDLGAVDLGTVGVDSQSMANCVNDAGHVVGVSYNYGELQAHAFEWLEGVLTPLGDFSPHGINAAGIIVGHQTQLTGGGLLVNHAAQWSGGVLADLGTLGGSYSEAYAVDSAGRIVGQSFLPDDVTVRACLWIGGVPRDLGSLMGTPGGDSSAADINDFGQIAGWTETEAGFHHACLFQVDAGGSVTARTDLGVLGDDFSYAYGINAAGVVVGCSGSRAFRWRQGVLEDLNALIPSGAGWTLSRASGLNDSGVIVGEGVRFGFQRAVMLTPVSCLKGDVSGDGAVDGLDVQPFLDAVSGSATPRAICAGDVADVGDGIVSLADLSNFVSCLLAGGCE
ncbi:MAG: hypothetical protein DCC65_05930 [Planctomycetota bacterium]|nr:MAG: hypothetical protein DCC65_05930 [Planctomycetota bacterium]